MDEWFTALNALLSVECVSLAVWGVSLSAATSLSIPTGTWAVPNRVERTLARVPWNSWRQNWATVPARAGTSDGMSALDDRVGNLAQTYRFAIQTWFFLPVAVGWFLLLLGTPFLVLTVGLAFTGASAWVVPALFALMNASALTLAVSLRQRTWTRRVPFDCRLVRAVAKARDNVATASGRSALGPELEEVAREAARDMESVLASRYLVNDGTATQALARAAWSHQVKPLLEASATRLLEPQPGDAAAWLTTWTDNLLMAFQEPAAGGLHPAQADDTGTLTTSPDYWPALPVAGTVFVSSAVVLLVVVLTPHLFDGFAWKEAIALPGSLVSIAALGALARGLRRRQHRHV